MVLWPSEEIRDVLPRKLRAGPWKMMLGRRSFPVENDPIFRGHVDFQWCIGLNFYRLHQLEVVTFLGESNHFETSVSKFKGRESPNLIGFPYSICPFSEFQGPEFGGVLWYLHLKKPMIRLMWDKSTFICCARISLPKKKHKYPPEV